MLKERYYYSEDLQYGELQAVLDGKLHLVALGPVKRHKRMPRVTVCGIWDTQDNTMVFGAARCATKDVFNRKEGAKLAYDRAINNPILKVDIGDEKVSDVFITNCRDIEQDIFEMSFPIKL